MIALVVGHSKSSPGAKNDKLNMTEFDFNSTLADDLSKKLTLLNMDHEIIYRDNYRDLPDKINNRNPNIIVSLHCNEFEEAPGQREATGTEMLYYHSSEKSKFIADVFQKNIVEALHLRNRGIKSKHVENLGGYLLRYTNAPCIITEPFFIDNDTDVNMVLRHYDDFVDAHISSIIEVAEDGKRSNRV